MNHLVFTLRIDRRHQQLKAQTSQQYARWQAARQLHYMHNRPFSR